MSELTKTLKYIADQLVKKEHREISKNMTVDEKVDFVNAISTLQEHSLVIQKGL